MAPSSRRQAACIGAAVALSLASAAATAAPLLVTTVDTNGQARQGPPSAGTLADPKQQSSDTGATLQLSSFSQQGPSTGSGDAVASLGALHAQAFATFPGFFTGEATGHAHAGWSDGFTIGIAGHTGQLAKLHAVVLVSGTLDTTGDGLATMTLLTGIAGINSGTISASFDRIRGLCVGITCHQQNGLPHTLDISGFITVGEPFQVSMSLETNAKALTGQFATGSADSFFSDTVTWGGITSITLGSVAVDDFSFSSLSGLDYTHAIVPTTPPTGVPEPGTAMLGLAGLVFLWNRRASRSS